VKSSFLWVSAVAASSVVLAAACGSNGGSTYTGGGDSGATDGTMVDAPHLIFEGGSSDAPHGGHCNPLTCAKLGYTCGPAGDGCGSSLDCGTCTAPATCGGGGKFSQCGGMSACVPKTCKDLGINCGPAGDGCGGALSCGSCTAPDICGGGGKPSTCGSSFVPPDGGIDGGACVPLSCTDQKIGCGPAGDGCGDTLACGSCTSPATCGGGGTPAVCGTPAPICTPKTCVDLGFNCGPAGDGCGGTLSCGTCTSPLKCGAGGKPSVCGSGFIPPDGGLDGGDCVPETCASQKISCGPAGDGCGDSLSCGTCTAPDTCGGGGTPGACGTNTTCKPATCASLGFNCGPAGDGCGGSLSCGTCVSPDICGGGGMPGVCGDVPACTGLCLDEPKCDSGTTTLTGTVVAGTQSPYLGTSSPDPVPNVLVYVPNTAPTAFTDGPACGCAPVSGAPVVSATTNYEGVFTLTNVPVPPGGSVPLVIQLGKWRRYFSVGSTVNPAFPVTACKTNSTGPIHMPRNSTEGDIPLTAISTGEVDAMECVLLKMGVDSTEFTDPGGTGRIQLFQGNGAVIDSKTPQETTLVPLTVSATELDLYDQVIFPCWGDDPRSGGENVKTAAQQTNIINYTTAGGRMFATHFSYAWLYDVSPFSTAATWIDDIQYNTGTAGIQQPSTFADVNTFYAWMNALTSDGSTLGQFAISNERNDFSAIGTNAELWVNVTGAAPKIGTDPTSFPVTFTFNTPFSTATPPPAACGRVIYSDFHVTNATDTDGAIFPAECTTGEMIAQEKSLEYLIWDLASCPPGPPPPECTPGTCASEGFTCGTQGDGCGGSLDCGTCTGCQVCGGGGTPGVCGGTCCVPETCTGLGIECGPAGDGCGGTLSCGTCPGGESCGGGGKSGICGQVDAGPCTPLTCASQGFNCGPAGDGCGGSLSCGTCTGCAVCGGGGPGVCGGACCVPETCASEGIECGPAGDGCGGSLSCGTCPMGESCGGGGKDGVCGAIDAGKCIPLTCAGQGINCGPAGDGCGGSLSCGTCPMGMTCGGGGTSGVCGAPSCTPKTCMQLGFNCGPAGDGCGGSLNCGVCTGGATCGGGGSPGVCGAPITK
jgi:hypothetical protein